MGILSPFLVGFYIMGIPSIVPGLFVAGHPHAVTKPKGRSAPNFSLVTAWTSMGRLYFQDFHGFSRS